MPASHSTHLRLKSGLSLLAALAAAALFLAGCGGGSSSDASKDPGVTFAAALQLEKQGDLTDAKQLFDDVIAKEPHNYYALYNLGLIAQQQHDLPTALSLYGQALKVKPGFVPALYNTATIYAVNRPLAAIALYRQVLKLQPRTPKAHFGLGLLEIKHGQPRMGVKDLATAVEQDSSLLSSVPANLRTLVQSQIPRHHGASPSATATASS